MILGNKEYPVRLSFVHLATPALTMDKTTMKYSVQVVVDKRDKETITAMAAAIAGAIKDGVSKKMFSAAAAKNPTFRTALRDGDQKAEEVEDGSQDYLKGCMFLNASCAENRPPVVVDRFGRQYEKADGDRSAIEEEVYSGCYALVSGNFFPFAHGTGGVAFGLNHVMKRGEGERLDGRESADAVFKDLVDTAEDKDASSEGEADLR